MIPIYSIILFFNIHYALYRAHYAEVLKNTLREKCPKIRRFSCPYFPACGLNTDQKNLVLGHFSRSDMEKVYPGNKEILLISCISVQEQERYPTRTAVGMRSEQIINRYAKTRGGITNFSTKQTSVNKCCTSRYSIHNVHVTFQGMIIKKIISAETIF